MLDSHCVQEGADDGAPHSAEGRVTGQAAPGQEEPTAAAGTATSGDASEAGRENGAAPGLRGGGRYSMHALPPLPLLPLHLNLSLGEGGRAHCRQARIPSLTRPALRARSQRASFSTLF